MSKWLNKPPRYIIIKWLKVKDKENVLKAPKERLIIYQKYSISEWKEGPR